MQGKILLWRGTRVPHPFTTNRRMKERAPWVSLCMRMHISVNLVKRAQIKQ